MRSVIFCSGFSIATAALQPWLTLLEVANALVGVGHEVVLATDEQAVPGKLPHPTKVFRNLRGSSSNVIRAWLDAERFDAAIVAVSPFSLATAGWYKALPRPRALAYLPSLYSFREVGRVWRWLSWRERWEYGRNLGVPAVFWRNRMTSCFASVVVQSQRTAGRIGPAVPVTVIPPGVDMSFWKPLPASPSPAVSFLFLGSALPIRGYQVLLDALQLLPSSITLRVLARGLTPHDENRLRRDLSARGLGERVVLRGGWLTRTDIRAEIQAAAAVIMPFLLVPSELPVSVAEAIACGTPVIASDIDGLPEMCGNAGKVVPTGDPRSLADTIGKLANGSHELADLQRACIVRREQWTGWNEMTANWLNLLEGQA